jgi:hypothetical protein
MTAEGEDPPKSFGNISEHHWSRARQGMNEEALEYYRKRSHDPGVEEGGKERNFYCMECGGVIPFDHASEACPHCSASLAEDAKRYFNWVEIDRPVASELRALWPMLLGGAALAVIAGWLLFEFLV